jgi:hypothetical protein
MASLGRLLLLSVISFGNAKIDFTHSVELRMDTGVPIGSHFINTCKLGNLDGQCLARRLKANFFLKWAMRSIIVSCISAELLTDIKNFDKKHLMQALKEIALQNGPS